MASNFAIRFAAHQIKHGGVVIYPTETVYGLGCDPLNSDAVDYLNKLKQRNPVNGLILLASTIDQLKPFIDLKNVPDPSRLLPTDQPTSWILPARNNVPNWIISRNGSIAVRITDHPVAVHLCNLLGHPLVSSSVNPSGKRPAENSLQIHAYFHDQVHSILVSDYPMSRKPSAIKRLPDEHTIRV